MTTPHEARRAKLKNDPLVRAVSRRVRNALDAALRIAKAEGCKRPALFFEAEGGIHIVDLDHPGEVHSDTCSTAERQRAVVFTLPDRTPPGSDVGAW